MKEKKTIKVLGIVGIILLAIFVVTTQYQISDLGKKDDGLPLFAKIFTDKSSGTVPFNVNFTSLVTNYEGEIKYLWDFGDGETSNEINPRHIYEENGSYHCSLTFSDSTGTEVTDSIIILVKENQGAIATIKIDPITSPRPYISGLPKATNAYAGAIIDKLINSPIPHPRLSKIKDWVTLEAQVTADPEGDEIVSYNWELRPPSYMNRISGSVSYPVYYFEGKNITIPGKYTYRLGLYKVTLIIEDEAGGNATISDDFTIDTSPEENKIAKMQFSYNNLNNKWLTKISKLAIAGLIISRIANRFEGNEYLPRVKMVLLLLLQTGWLINWEGSDSLIFELYGQFLEKRPVRRELVNKSLHIIQSILINLKDKFPKQEELMDGLIDFVQNMLENLGLSNMRPELSNPFPEHKKDYMPRDLPYVSIDVNDTEGDTFDIRIYGDNITEVNLSDQVSGTFTADLITPLPAVETITWYVEVIDHQGKEVHAEYWFETSNL